MAREALQALIAARARTAAPEPAAGEAERHARALRDRHGPGVAAVLMYGSSLRDGAVDGRLLDFYVLVDRIGPAYRSALPRLLGALDQPNVHYLAPVDRRRAPAKYALMTLDAFCRRAGPGGFSSYIWGRFAQPCWIVWTRDGETETRVLTALEDAAGAMLGAAAPLLPADASAGTVWIRAFAESYRAEPRSEPPGKAEEIYRANAEHYDAVAAVLLPELAGADGGASEKAWARRRVWGKALAVARIAKSALTFEGGLDYAIWKIGRHSGADVGAPRTRGEKIATLWRLIRTRAIR